MCCSLLRGIFKIVMFVMNLAVFLCGIGMIIIGSLMLAQEEYKWLEDIIGSDEFNTQAIMATGIILIVAGSLLFLTGFFGCYGTCKENDCMLTMYVIIVGILFLLTITCGILAIIYHDDLSEEVRRDMQQSINVTYGIDTDVTNSWDNLQRNLECCGAVDFNDYMTSAWKDANTEHVPMSCCDGVTSNTTDYVRCWQFKAEDILFQKGCYTKMNEWVDSAGIIIIASVFLIAGLLLFGIIAACCIKGKMDKDNMA